MQLEQLKISGWSWQVGYSQDYKTYTARIWKQRDRPIKVKAVGGKDWISVVFICSSQGNCEAEALENCWKKLIRLTNSDLTNGHKVDNYQNLENKFRGLWNEFDQ